MRIRRRPLDVPEPPGPWVSMTPLLNREPVGETVHAPARLTSHMTIEATGTMTGIFDADGESVAAAYRNDKLPPVVRMAIEWQFRKTESIGYLVGEFRNLLWDVIDHADETNLIALGRGFPNEVLAVHKWRNESGFADRVYEAVEESPQGEITWG